MGLSTEENEERKRDEHVNAIEVTDKDSGKDFVFISYKSDDWKVVLHDIVYELHKTYGLRVYCDKIFDERNKLWVSQFRENMEDNRCKGVVAFIDDEYATSYATLMELMCSQCVQGSGSREVRLPVIPVNLGKLTDITDESDTGLGIKRKKGCTNYNAGNEEKAFYNLYTELYKATIIVGNRYEKGKPLSKRNCSKIIEQLLEELDVNDNPYEYEKGDDTGFFCSKLAECIREAAGDSVFEEKEDVSVSVKSVSSEAQASYGERVPSEPSAQDSSSFSLQGESVSSSIKRTKVSKMKLSEMVKKGIVKCGDAVYVQGHPKDVGYIAGGNEIRYQEDEVSLNRYVKQVFGDDASRNAYVYVYHRATGKLLNELRDLEPQQESADADRIGWETEPAEISKSVEPVADVFCTDQEPARDEIIALCPLDIQQCSPGEKKEGDSGFQVNTVYRYSFFGETASIRILSTRKAGKGMKVDAVLLAGSTIKELWVGDSIDFRMDEGGKRRARILYNQILPKTRRFKSGYRKVMEDIWIEDESLSAIATMVSGASVAPIVAWKE